MKLLAASTAALLLLASAASAAETTSIAVRAKLDPSNPQDQKVMMHRIDAAALEACGAQRGSFAEVKRAVAASACHRDAVAGAVAQLKTSQASLDTAGAR
ncbi:UrcA family protein [Caulobacter sp. DWR2-3-1b2]|uniref:UrcA family protein n=1 Tax=unclassified Caulobacter TaxID=2648921 RepID=UPI0019C3B86C|nr:UrcA family protein [Caulobacter sp.]